MRSSRHPPSVIRFWRNRQQVFFLCCCAALAAGELLWSAAPAWAAEGGVGRPITGQQILPLGAVLPTATGLIASVSSVYYEGSLSGSKQVPIGGSLSAGLDYHVSYNLFSSLYVWGLSGQWSFGSSISLPIQYSDIKTTASGSLITRSSQDTSTQFADMLFAPILADYHVSEQTHLLFNFQFFAPTGSYDQNRVANAGQNSWTFIPSFAYTTILPENNIELTGIAALELYTRNDATDYRTGNIFRFDGLAIKRFQNGLGGGLSVGWIQQVTDDQGPVAELLNGFRGHSLGLGPIATYEKKVGNTNISSSLRWVHEFDVVNRPKGNSAQLSITAQF